ncbi:ABC transporter ATP-binding protein [Aquibacillus rhizosphaerae]|uniref:ATP-binding cassette domain-containing protein n=1 Tax=Aquibacillus rhizosphaerae TaxID=3051431 RepID=A0ABT7L8B0_9BACI|nr:ATP-binding cassette domain-containing protein [Aquibacillus sp. LR5S19]MDL4842093.1 ATP-binding cassette domain-containing protein [Aquibacillus sp. LR5S19]
MLKVEALSKHYGSKKVLSDVSFQINPGEVVGLVGENGAGKSTLLNILATLISPDKGNLSFDDHSYDSDLQKVRKKIGYIPQDIAVWEDFTVEENMVFFEQLSWKKKSKAELRQLCQNMKLEQWKEKTQSLSGGMKRKLNIAISLIHDPDILLLDEPTVGIDLKSRKEIGSYLHGLAKHEGKTVIYTSHDMEEILSFCDRVYCIGEDPFYKELLEENGKLVQVL